ncbi:Sterol-sensing domain and Patched family-containing protein [Strongyloides ratti]|uniref:Sterol-sensing domain and Patched family-containing protein n=1 Tax=Strongyloides ratti TaxID=34506 RepID=A0A090L6B0_STRRB|nr:Sterol-sensing domain and Patched family-containing protein [Strongyloides ratti]CEF63049.1 Sterol-sensing domain and Patched family-containing protein [Strongyloides ratti]
MRGVQKLYIPVSAPCLVEENVFRNIWLRNDKYFYPGKDIMLRKNLYFIIESNELLNDNILQPKVIKEFIQFIDWISNATVYYPITRTSKLSYDNNFKNNSIEKIKSKMITKLPYTYSSVCLHYQNRCFTNSHARLLADIYSKSHQKIMNVSYPVFQTQFSTESIDISKTLGGVELEDVIDKTTGKITKIVKSAKTFLLVYQFRNDQTEYITINGTSIDVNTLSSHFAKEIIKLIHMKNFPFKRIKINHFHSDSIDEELDEANKRITPKFSITITILIIFSILCTFTIIKISISKNEKTFLSNIFVIDFRASKPYLSLIAILYTLMAIITSIGILLFFNIPFSDICVVMPFLSLTIGIDDSFLLLSSWHDSSRKLRYDKRLEETLLKAGLSITITSLTDSLAFLIGSLAELLAVKYFCYYSAIAVFFIWIYSLTVYISILGFLGKKEEEEKNCFLLWKNINPKENIDTINDIKKENNISSFVKKIFNTGYNSTIISDNKKNMWYSTFFGDYYAPFISKPSIQILAFVSYLFYIYLTVTGINYHLSIGFEVSSLLNSDSPVKAFFDLKKKYFIFDESKIEVAILRAPKFWIKNERELFDNFIYTLHNDECINSGEKIDLWYYGYKEYFSKLGFGAPEIWESVIKNNKTFERNLKGFFMENEKYKYDVIFNNNISNINNNGMIQSFRFSIHLNSTKLNEPGDITFCCNKIRKFLKTKNILFNELFKPISWSPLWVLSDQFSIIWDQTMQDIYISIVVMMLISLLFIPSISCCIAIPITIASIGFGVLGFMSYWNVRLDATSMIAIAMSVGFSVDFAAHATFAFVEAEGELRKKEVLEKRLSHQKNITPEYSNRFYYPYKQLSLSLSHIGWPILQSSLAVLLGISVLATIKTYIVETCFKCIFLVISFGLLHSLLYLPLTLMNLKIFFEWYSKKINNNDN